MKEYFQTQTGNISFLVSVVPQFSSGSAEINFGQDGLPQKTFSFYLNNGFLSDGDKVIFGSYERDKPFEITGTFLFDSCEYFYNGLIARSKYKTANQDINYIEFLKSGDNSGSYQITYSVKGSIKNNDKNLLYISKSGNDESGFLSIARNLGIFSGQIGIQTGYENYTGLLSLSTISQLNLYDAVVIGEKTLRTDFSDSDGWSRVLSPIVFLNPDVFSEDGMGVLQGTEQISSSILYADYDEENPDSNFETFKKYTRRCEKSEGAFDIFTESPRNFLVWNDQILGSDYLSGNYPDGNFSQTLPNAESEWKTTLMTSELKDGGYYNLRFSITQVFGTPYTGTATVKYAGISLGNFEISAGRKDFYFFGTPLIGFVEIEWEEVEESSGSAILFSNLELKYQKGSIEKILYNDDYVNIGILKGVNSEYAEQSGQRILLNNPYQSSGYAESTDNWKKIFGSILYSI